MDLLTYLSKFKLLRRGGSILCALILINLPLEAQIRTYILGPEQILSDMLPFYVPDQPVAKILAEVDVKAVLEEDRRLNRRPNRYGIKIPTNFTEQDGEWYELGPLSVWKIRIYSRDATAMNFHFKDMHIPEGSEMYLYSEARNMIAGPILPRHVRNGSMTTDQIFGEEGTIVVYVPLKYRDEFTITIRNVIHEFEKPRDFQRGYGDSQECNNNINCPLGSTWQNERDAVCLILAGINGGTGTLINNACQDITPYILTANHVLESQYSDPVEDWIFRFNYESNTSTCHGHQGEPPWSIWQWFSGADVRAQWESTDFALLELFQPVIGYPNLAMAGWDRSSSIPDSLTIIHHPDGDVKKITIDAGSAVVDDDPPFNLGDDHAFRLEFTNGSNGDDGIIEGGSSGCGVFNDEHRIIGNEVGGENEHCENAFEKWVGRLYNSWTGGGSSSNRLSDWLGGNGDPTTTNTIQVPYISGDDILCTSSKTYSLQNIIPGSSSDGWTVSPTGLFGSATSGSGTSASLYAASASSSGEATITFTMSGGSCNPVEVNKTIWVGIPDFVLTTVDGQTPQSPHNIDNPAYLVASAEGDNPSYSWFIATGDGSIYPNGNTCVAYAYPYVSVKAEATNECGDKSYYFYLLDGGSYRLTSSNPTIGRFSLEIDKYKKDPLQRVIVTDPYNRIVLKLENNNFVSNRFVEVDLAPFSSGIYYLSMMFEGGEIVTEKIIKF